jgi:hypothetical protein
MLGELATINFFADGLIATGEHLDTLGDRKATA